MMKDVGVLICSSVFSLLMCHLFRPSAFSWPSLVQWSCLFSAFKTKTKEEDQQPVRFVERLDDRFSKGRVVQFFGRPSPHKNQHFS